MLLPGDAVSASLAACCLGVLLLRLLVLLQRGSSVVGDWCWVCVCKRAAQDGAGGGVAICQPGPQRPCCFSGCHIWSSRIIEITLGPSWLPNPTGQPSPASCEQAGSSALLARLASIADRSIDRPTQGSGVHAAQGVLGSKWHQGGSPMLWWGLLKSVANLLTHPGCPASPAELMYSGKPGLPAFRLAAQDRARLILLILRDLQQRAHNRATSSSRHAQKPTSRPPAVGPTAAVQPRFPHTFKGTPHVPASLPPGLSAPCARGRQQRRPRPLRGSPSPMCMHVLPYYAWTGSHNVSLSAPASGPAASRFVLVLSRDPRLVPAPPPCPAGGARPCGGRPVLQEGKGATWAAGKHGPATTPPPPPPPPLNPCAPTSVAG